MKTVFFIIGLSAGLMGRALAQANPPGSPSEGTNEISSDDLVTKLGTVYHKYHVEKVNPAGLTISYRIDGGGLGMEKIPANLLPDDWQQRYGFDSDKDANPPVIPTKVTSEVSSDELVTKLGTVYHQYRIERVDPAGLTIGYGLPRGGLGMENIPFNLLPDDWQLRYGFDPDKAAKFDLEQKQALAQLREQMIAEEQAYKEKQAQEEATNQAAAQAKIDAEAAKNPADTAVTQATNSPAITDTNLPAPPLPAGGS
jgi:hypothetical protein